MVYENPVVSDETPEGIAVGMMLDYRDLAGRTPPEGSIEAALFEVMAQAHYRTRLAVARNAEQVMAAVAQFHGIPRKTAAPAQGILRVDGPQGTTFAPGLEVTDEHGHVWVTESHGIIRVGHADVPVVCTSPGRLSERPGPTVNAIGNQPWITGLSLIQVTFMGRDEETIWDYLARSRNELAFQSIVPRLPHEYADYAKRYPKVTRAVAINRSNNGVEANGYVTVYVAGEQANTIQEEDLVNIQAMMNAATARPLGVKVIVAVPELLPIDVAVRAKASQDAWTNVQAAIKTRLEEWAKHDEWDWSTPTITSLDIARAIGTDIPGLNGLAGVTLDGQSSIDLATGGTPTMPVFTFQITKA